MNFSNEKDLPYLRSAAQALQDENARLRAETAEALAAKAKLEAQLKEKDARLSELAETNAEMAAANAKQQEELERLAQELRGLKEQLERRIKALYGRKSERRPATEAAEPAAATKQPRKPQKGHGPTPQPRLPVEEVRNTLAEEARNCEHCGGTLEPMGSVAEETELIAIEARRIVLERHLREKYRCACCQTGVTVAPGPVKVIPGGRYALNFAVEVAVMKYLFHLPLERQVQMMRHDGLRVTTATLYDQVDALATTLTPTYQAIWATVQAEAVLRADETPWNVLSNGHTKNERFYAWVAVGSEYVAYRLLDTRSKEGAAAILGSFAGTLMVDGLTSYPAAAKGAAGEMPRFKVANCHAHARRKFVECEKHNPEESAFALDLYRRLYEVEREGKEADLGALRVSKSRPILEELFAWAKAQRARPDLLPSSGLAKALAYLLNHETGLRVYLDDAAVPIDNNESERAMRSPVLGRKNHYGSRSRRGTETAAILYTLVESAKRVGVNPKAYLEAAAEHALRKAGAVLLPDEFKRQLDEAATPPPNSA
jgi:transposase